VNLFPIPFEIDYPLGSLPTNNFSGGLSYDRRASDVLTVVITIRLNVVVLVVVVAMVSVMELSIGRGGSDKMVAWHCTWHCSGGAGKLEIWHCIFFCFNLFRFCSLPATFAVLYLQLSPKRTAIKTSKRACVGF
jgi:hypothetical protein